MMICLTGDVHHASMGGHDQKLLGGRTEVDCCYPYLQIVNEYGITPTLFFTGKALREEGEKIKDLQEKYSFDIGGHSYRAFNPHFFYGACNKLFGLANGPKFLQRRDIEATIKVIEDSLGVCIKTWRDHAYRHDKNTYPLLDEHGIKVVSDEVNNAKYHPEQVAKGLYSFPINILPDHEYLEHSRAQKGNYSIKEWFDLVKRKISIINEEPNSIVTLLVHPACMYIEDRFKLFEKLCKYITRFKTSSLTGALSVLKSGVQNATGT